MNWQSLLFINTSDATPSALAIGDWLKQHGYKAYDPFPGGLGSPIGKVSRLRMFLAPPTDGWTRLMVAPSDELPAELVQALGMDAIWPRLMGTEQFSVAHVSAVGEMNTSWEAFRPYLKPDLDVQHLNDAANRPIVIDPRTSNLPNDVQQMAASHGIEMGQVDKLMGKMTRRLFDKDQEGDALQQAQAGLASQTSVNWNTVSGQRLMAVMACLTVPEDYWRLPLWDSLTAAYQVARQRQRGQGDLLPTDAATLAVVPNALDYTLLYFSKKITA